LKSRNLLGESFGTKKVKQKIRALEKNRIGSNALSSSTSEIQTAIDTGALNAPSKGFLFLSILFHGYIVILLIK